MPPTPLQSLQPSVEAMQLQMEVEDQESGSCEMEYEGERRWTARARDRTAIAKMEKYLNESEWNKSKEARIQIAVSSRQCAVPTLQ